MGGYRCCLCWAEFDAPVALLEHEEAEERALAAGELAGSVREVLGDSIG